MSKLPNKTRGEVPFPEAGENARLIYSIDAMERFYGELGDEYREKLVAQIANETPPSFLRTAFNVMLVDGVSDGFPFNLTNDEIKIRLLDAVSLGMTGKIFEEAQKQAEEEERERQKKRAAELTENPALALLDPNLLNLLSQAVASSDSPSQKSEDTPTSTSSDKTIESEKKNEITTSQ